MNTSVIVAGARTPVGKFLGALKDMSGVQLGAAAIAAALDKAKVPAEDVQYVIMGQVLTAGAGQMPARQAAIAAGVPMTVPALTVNKVCLSGIESIILADQFVRSGAFEVVIAGGQESMSQAPHLLSSSRTGTKYGDGRLLDHIVHDGLHDAFTDQSMGLLTEQGNDKAPLTSDDLNNFSASSHQRANEAWVNGLMDDEVISVKVAGRGGPVEVHADEGIRPETTAESLAALPPAFRPDGVLTAGSSSPLSDGAAAVVVMSKERAERLGLTWLAEIRSHGLVAGPDSGLQLQPANAIAAACAAEGIEPTDLDLVEINEAFAAVGVASTRELGIDPDRVNVNGGAIAIGHPIGMSGARIILHLALELARRGGGIGAASLCGGGGQGNALIIRVPKAQTPSLS